MVSAPRGSLHFTELFRAVDIHVTPIESFVKMAESYVTPTKAVLTNLRRGLIICVQMVMEVDQDGVEEEVAEEEAVEGVVEVAVEVVVAVEADAKYMLGFNQSMVFIESIYTKSKHCQ